MIDRLSVPSSTGILVLGMHRSGTSAFTGFSHLLGAALGERLMGALATNEKGHWESLAVYEAHEKLLAALDRRWDDFREMPDEWLQHPETARAGVAVRRFVQQELLGHELWAVKEPRMCRLLPMWRKALSDLPVRLVSVVVVRNPLEVAASLAKRNGMDHAGAILLWMQHLLEAERASRGMPRTIVHYSDLLADWRAVAGAVSRDLGVAWPNPIDRVATEIDAFLSPRFRHHDVRLSEGDTGSALPALARQLYESCLDAGNPGVWARIAAVSDKVAQAAALYGPCMEEIVSRGRSAEQRATLAEATVAHGLAKPQLLLEQNELIKQSRDQSGATFAKLERTESLLAELVREAAVQRQEISTNRGMSADMEARLSTGMESFDRHMSEVVSAMEARLSTGMESFDRHMSEVVSALAAESARASDLAERLALSERQRAEVLASASWRLTAPLRRLWRLISRASPT